MAVKETFICDVCGAERQGTNHWFLGSTSSTYTKNPESLILFQFNHADARNAAYSVLCGEACVIKWVSSKLAALQQESV